MQYKKTHAILTGKTITFVLLQLQTIFQYLVAFLLSETEASLALPMKMDGIPHWIGKHFTKIILKLASK